MKFAPYSFSKLTTFEDCPQRFKFQYIDKIKRDDRNEALVKGSNVHNILEKFGTYKLDNTAEENIVRNFVKSEIAKKYLPSLVGIEKSIRETSIGLDENFEPCSYYSKRAVFRGKVDFICKIDNVLNICDYKTGKYKDEVYQDYRQLLLYSLFFFKKYPNVDTIRISYIYVEHNLENSMMLERKYLDKYLETLSNMINNVETATEYNRKTKFCNWCPYKDLCYHPDGAVKSV